MLILEAVQHGRNDHSIDNERDHKQNRMVQDARTEENRRELGSTRGHELSILSQLTCSVNLLLLILQQKLLHQLQLLPDENKRNNTTATQ